MKKLPLITIVGPTASGKTALSLFLARRLGAVILSGDAYQVYRGMNIGTAKASPEERREIPHYLIDCMNPGDIYSAGIFQEQAGRLIRSAYRKGIIPILAGGTGLYVQGLLEGYSFRPKGKGRSDYRKLYDREGSQGLARELAEKKGVSVLDLPRDPQRMIRELELIDAGADPDKKSKSKERIYEGPVIGLFMGRQKLYERINLRAENMIKKGLRQEVESLLAQGVSPDAQCMRGIGYQEMLSVIRGDIPEEEGLRLIQRNTRHFAKRQMTWFRRMPYIRWFEGKEGAETALEESVFQYVRQELDRMAVQIKPSEKQRQEKL